MVNDPVYKDMVDFTSTIGTEFYAFNTQTAPTDDARVRKALSLAIDRVVAGRQRQQGQRPTGAMVCDIPALRARRNEASYPDLGVKYDPERRKPSWTNI